MIKKIINEIKSNILYYIVIVLIILGNIITLDYEIYSPGSLENLSDRINVEDSYSSKGSFNLTYVTSRRASLIASAIAYFIPSWDLVSMDDARIENESNEEIFTRGQIYLKMTSYDAIIAAFKEANINYEIKNTNLTVSYIYSESDTDLEIGDIITRINNIEINSYDSLRNEINKYKENDKVTITVKRENKEKECYAVLRKDKNDNIIIIGVYIAKLYDVNTTPKVEYLFKDNESGSSRGLMCALEIYNRITEYDLTKGKIISGTGTIDENGNVGSIEGVKYKLKGAVKNSADVFIVPTENYEEAIKLKNENNYDIILIEADNLKNVIKKLKNL